MVSIVGVGEFVPEINRDFLLSDQIFDNCMFKHLTYLRIYKADAQIHEFRITNMDLYE